MKATLFAQLTACAVLLFSGCAPKAPAPAVVVTTPTVVEAACGRCLFGLKEDKQCNLAIRVNGRSYFIDGFHIRQFGNPDLQGGMCKKIHSARVAGKVVNGRFVAQSFELMPMASR